MIWIADLEMDPSMQPEMECSTMARKASSKLKERLEDRYAPVSQSSHSKVLDELLSQQVMNLNSGQSK